MAISGLVVSFWLSPSRAVAPLYLDRLPRSPTPRPKVYGCSVKIGNHPYTVLEHHVQDWHSEICQGPNNEPWQSEDLGKPKIRCPIQREWQTMRGTLKNRRARKGCGNPNQYVIQSSSLGLLIKVGILYCRSPFLIRCSGASPRQMKRLIIYSRLQPS